MKNLVVLSLLAAIGAVLWIEKVEAAPLGAECWTRNGVTICRQNPLPPGPPPVARGQPPQMMPFPPEANDRPFPRYRRPPPPPIEFNSRCVEIAQALTVQGFSMVRMLSCRGRTYVYHARRGGDGLNLFVSSQSGRIRRIERSY